MGRRGWRQGSHRSQDRPLHAEPDLRRSPDRVGTSSDRPIRAEQIRRSWAAWERAATGPVEELGLVGEPDPEAVWGRAEEVVVVASDGIADGPAPPVGVE